MTAPAPLTVAKAREALARVTHSTYPDTFAHRVEALIRACLAESRGTEAKGGCAHPLTETLIDGGSVITACLSCGAEIGSPQPKPPERAEVGEPTVHPPEVPPHIVNTSPRAASVVSTSPKAKTVDPAAVAGAVGGEIAGAVPPATFIEQHGSINEVSPAPARAEDQAGQREEKP